MNNFNAKKIKAYIASKKKKGEAIAPPTLSKVTKEIVKDSSKR